jgi:hypothetical protein
MEHAMLWTAAMTQGYAVAGTDGRLGTVIDLLFDDASWTMRWLVVRTGDWFPNHDVLLPVSAVGQLDPVRREFRVALTVQQIRDSPRIERDLPVSRQEEAGSPLRRAAVGRLAGYAVLSASGANDPHLRSMEAVLGHLVHANDGLIGHVDDFLVDDAAWSIRFIKIDTRDWGPARRVSLSPRLVRRIDWLARAVHLHVDRRAIESRSLSGPALEAGAVDGELLLACKDIRWSSE